jgi:hypothetical protein
MYTKEALPVHIGGWMGPRTGLDDVEKEKSWPYRDSNSDPSVTQPVASHYTDWASPDTLHDQRCENLKSYT